MEGKTNAQVAIEAASRVHQNWQGERYSVDVLATANAFLDWLRQNS